MAVSKAQQKAVANYMKNNYDEIKIRVPKGQKDIIKAHAELFDNGSVNRYISRLIDEDISKQDKI